MFRAYLHTGFLKDGALVLHKRDLDDAADDANCKHFAADFKITLQLKRHVVCLFSHLYLI